MKNISQRTLESNIELVKYENPPEKDQFNLTTLHSLLIDHNKKFIELKQLIIDYNSREMKKAINRPTLNRAFIQRLYKMLSELTRIYHTENQLEFLNKIYTWAFQGKKQAQEEEENFDASNLQSKDRPVTASTRTRPYSAYTRKTRPDSAIPSKASIGNVSKKKTFQSEEVITQATMKKYPEVDFKKLKHGQKDFFLGHRTLHPEEEKPKKRLKQYFRKNLDQKGTLEKDSDDQALFDEFQEQKEEEMVQKQNLNKLMEIPLQVQEPVQEKPEDGAQKIEGQVDLAGEHGEGQNQGLAGQEDANIDDLVGDDEQGLADEEEVQEIDKLKPNIKAFQKNKINQFTRNNQRKFNDGIMREYNNQNKYVQQNKQDAVMEEMMRQWAGSRYRVTSEQRRRAQSARIMTKPVGIVFQKKQVNLLNDDHGLEVIDLSNVPNMVTMKTGIRPKTAFKPESERVKNEAIKDALTTGKLEKHMKKQQEEVQLGQVKIVAPVAPQQVKRMTSYSVTDRLTSIAPKPKKKTFEQILRQAEQKVQNEAQDQIENLKEKLTMNKITIGASKIVKSLTYHENEIYEGQFTGAIAGKSMLNNPFFKVAKKKKKKKKKK